jgi:hypothetical protein
VTFAARTRGNLVAATRFSVEIAFDGAHDQAVKDIVRFLGVADIFEGFSRVSATDVE